MEMHQFRFFGFEIYMGRDDVNEYKKQKNGTAIHAWFGGRQNRIICSHTEKGTGVFEETFVRGLAFPGKECKL